MAGAGVWAVAALLFDLDRIEFLLLLAPLVLVPLGIALAAPSGPAPLRPAWRLLPPAATVSAALLAVGLVFRPGGWSLALTVPWLVSTALIALSGLLRAVEWLRSIRRLDRIDRLVIDAGMVFLAVGGSWTSLSAAGVRPLGFAEPIVLLTGVHFHYSGFVMSVLAGWLAFRRGDALGRLLAVGVVLGVPLVAAGIVAGGVVGWLQVELAAAVFLGAVGVGLGLLQIRTASAGPASGGPASVPGRWLLGLSGLALVAGMLLAVAYPLGRVLGALWLDIPTMAATHGTLNAVGFGLLGLLAWTLEERREAVTG